LGPAFALHIAHKKDALAFTKASSHLFSDGQQSFVTICPPRPPFSLRPTVRSSLFLAIDENAFSILPGT
jgi:hypothetical protein